jgi:protein SCO1/2
MAKKQIFPIGSLVIALVFGLVLLITHLLVKPPAPPAELEGVLRKDFRPIGAFELQSRDHGPISQASLQGKWSYVFFGYMSCPDVCPNTLHELNSFRSLLADEAGAEPEELQVIFVSVDPDRDSTENLASYVLSVRPPAREPSSASPGNSAPTTSSKRKPRRGNTWSLIPAPSSWSIRWAGWWPVFRNRTTPRRWRRSIEKSPPTFPERASRRQTSAGYRSGLSDLFHCL